MSLYEKHPNDKEQQRLDSGNLPRKMHTPNLLMDPQTTKGFN